MFEVIRKIAWIFLLILITVAAIPEIPSKGKQLTRMSDTQLNDDSMPRFAEPIPNVTVSVGRDALLACVVENLKGYKVAWVRVDTQTILSIHHNVITQNNRISLSYNDHRSWYLHIKEVEESDRGWYMCQVNTDPMRSRKGYLQVVVPPMIIESMTSNDMVVRESTNVTLMCKARGYPEPYVMWRREDGEEMNIGGENVNVVDGEILQITKVSRLHMAAYLCVASNGVPPSISKRVHLRVQFPPMLSIANQLEATYIGQEVTLECETEAYPASINYWTTERGDMIISDTSRAGDKFETTSLTRGYHKFMKLKIRNVGPNDFGSYRCVAKNSLGETDGIIKLDEIPTPTTTIVSGDVNMHNRTLGGKRPHNRKFEPNAIPDYGLEEWKDGGDTNQPTSVRHPPGAFHNKASSGYSINSKYYTIIPFIYWLRAPFDGIKSSTITLIKTSFLWLDSTKKSTSSSSSSILPILMTKIRKINNFISSKLIQSTNNNNNNPDSDNDQIYYYNNILGKFIHQKNNTIVTPINIMTKYDQKFSFIDDTCCYCYDSKYKYLNIISTINNKNIKINSYNNNINILDNINNSNDDLIFILYNIIQRIFIILYETVNFHIIQTIIIFIQMNFHIFIMLALNLISVNLVKNILLLPGVLLLSSSSSTSSSSSLSLLEKEKLTRTTTTPLHSNFEMEKIKENNFIIKRTHELSPKEKPVGLKQFPTLSTLIKTESLSKYASNSYLMMIMMKNYNSPSRISSSSTSWYLNIIIINDPIDVNENNTNTYKINNLNECIKMSKTTVIIKYKTIKTKQLLSWVNR